ncbi:hypothetical protein MYX75_02025 [Acidobacteria bacterium AH-259-A15]|nr:hypothetical protein [Acidobacteria bacterium AH-259-A15]
MLTWWNSLETVSRWTTILTAAAVAFTLFAGVLGVFAWLFNTRTRTLNKEREATHAEEATAAGDGRIELRSIFFQPVAVYSNESEFPNWGYENPILFSGIEGTIQSYKLLNDLVLWDPASGSPVGSTKRMLTIADYTQQSRGMNLDLEVRKRVLLKISFRNAGKSPIQNVAAKVDFLLNEAATSQNPSFQGSPPIRELLGENEFHIKPYLYLPLNGLLQTPLKLRISVALHHNEHPKTETFHVMYDLTTDTWNWN